MGLNIRLLRGNRCVINGAVITCLSQRLTISIENFAQVLRAPDILDQGKVKTPTERVYFTVQLMLIDPHNAEGHRFLFNKSVGRLLAAFSNAEIHVLLHEAINHVEKVDYYRALKALKKVLEYEREVLKTEPGETAPAHVAAELGP